MNRVIWLLVILLLTAMMVGCGVAVYQGEAEAADPELARLKQDLVLAQQRNQDLLLEKQALVAKEEQFSQLVRVLKKLTEAGLPIRLEELNLEIIDELAIGEREVTQTNGATEAEFKDSNKESQRNKNEEDVK